MKMFQATLLLLCILPCCYSKGNTTKPERSVRNGKQLRIYNGGDASGTEFPFMALVLANTQFDELQGVLAQNMCGGSILSERIILTAAHCVVRDISLDGDTQDEIYHPRNLNVWVGDLENEDEEQFLYVRGLIVHEDYDSFSVINDIALLILEPDIAFTDDIAAISLPETADMAALYGDGAAVTVIGWGTTEEGETSTTLQKLSYEVTAEADCDTSYGDQIHEGMMCTGTSPMREHSSTGDSGGPLFTKHNGKWTQLGLVSWGAEIQTSSTYDVNTKVGFYKSWVEDNMEKALSDYITSETAEDVTKTLEYSALRRFLYKTISITPEDDEKFTEIKIESGKMSSQSFLMVYDGSSVVSDKMLAQLSGTIQPRTFTATSSAGLTVAIVTGDEGKLDRISLRYKQVEDKGDSNKLKCASGYAACSDKFYCLQKEFFCDAANAGQCVDASDEIQVVCDNVSLTGGNSEAEDSGSLGGSADQLSLILTLVMLLVRVFL